MKTRSVFGLLAGELVARNVMLVIVVIIASTGEHLIFSSAEHQLFNSIYSPADLNRNLFRDFFYDLQMLCMAVLWRRYRLQSYTHIHAHAHTHTNMHTHALKQEDRDSSFNHLDFDWGSGTSV